MSEPTQDSMPAAADPNTRRPYPQEDYEGVPTWYIKKRITRMTQLLEELPDGRSHLRKRNDRLLTRDEVVAYFRYSFRCSKYDFRTKHKPLLRKYAHGEEKSGEPRIQRFYESQVVATIRKIKADSFAVS